MIHGAKCSGPEKISGHVLTPGSLQGNMPALLSHYRPDAIIYAFTENRAVQRRLALYHGVYALHMSFGETADETFKRYLLLSPDTLPMPALSGCIAQFMPSAVCGYRRFWEV